MPTALLTPYDRGQAVELGRRTFRKQLLPVGSIDYQGQRLHFTRDYLARLAKGFRDGAYDMVGVVMTDAQNRHTLDPERLRGEVKGLELTADGLDAIVELGDTAAKVVTEHPNVGVSARIMKGLARADGRHWPDVLQHILITTEPHVPGMRPWQAIEFAGDVDQVVDLTAADYEGEAMPYQLSDEDRQAIARDVADLIRSNPTSPAAPGGTEGSSSPQNGPRPPTQPATPPAAPQDGSGSQPPAGDPPRDDDGDLTDEQLDKLLTELEAEETTSQPAETGVGLSRDDLSAIALAQADAAQAREETTAMRAQLAGERWRHESADWAREGLTPVLLDLARPYLAAADDHVIELAGGSQGNVTDTIRRMLRLIADGHAVVELAAERGHGFNQPTDQQTLDAMNEALDAEYGA